MNEIAGFIFDIRKFSLHDGPGIRTTVFFKGCPLACWWCHNPESQSAASELMLWPSRCVRCGSCASVCPQTAVNPVEEKSIVGVSLAATTAATTTIDSPTPINQYETNRQICVVCEACMEACSADARELVGRHVTVAQVMEEVERDRTFYEESHGGVTFSGGEPLAQRAFLMEALKACKALDLHTTVDTCGYTPWVALDSIRPYTDLFMFDLKIMDNVRHEKYTGVPNGLILHNLEALVRYGSRVIVRVPVIPEMNDDDENLDQMGIFLAGLENVERVDLLPYHPSGAGKYARLGKDYRMPETDTPNTERMVEVAAHLQNKYHLNVNIGG